MRLSTITVLVTGCATIVTSCNRTTPTSTSAQQSSPSISPVPIAAPPTHATVQLPSGATIADVAAKVTPSVVNVFSERTISRANASRSPSDPFFRFFFDEPNDPLRQNPMQRQRSLGSGVIVSTDGVILTNNHVVERADKVRVALNDGRELEAKVVGTDPPSDLAVLRVQDKELPAIGVADASKSRIGDLVLAIGNPFGIGQTVTMGIVSAVGRANMGITDYEDFIQTDAAINPGNSGGALVDMQGNLIGINTAIVSQSGGYQGIGFAIPSTMAVQVKEAILHGGKVMRGWLGVTVQDLTEDLARSLQLQPHQGVLVSDVTPNSPAAKAGIERGDVIVAVDGSPTNTSAQLRNVIALAGRDKHVRIDVKHSGKLRNLDVELGDAPTADSGAPQVLEQGVLGGVTVEPLDRAARNRLHVPSAITGVLVTHLEPDNPATEMGLHEGDVIVEVNRSKTPTVEAFRKALADSEHGVLLLVYRDGSTLYMSRWK